MNILKHNHVFFISVQALCWSQGQHRGQWDTRVWHWFLCRLRTDPLYSRGNDPDLPNGSGEKLQNLKKN